MSPKVKKTIVPRNRQKCAMMNLSGPVNRYKIIFNKNKISWNTFIYQSALQHTTYVVLFIFATWNPKNQQLQNLTIFDISA